MKTMLNLKCPIQDVYQKKVGFIGRLLCINAFVHMYFANFVQINYVNRFKQTSLESYYKPPILLEGVMELDYV
jgi:hypothetical protein